MHTGARGPGVRSGVAAGLSPTRPFPSGPTADGNASGPDAPVRALSARPRDGKVDARPTSRGIGAAVRRRVTRERGPKEETTMRIQRGGQALRLAAGTAAIMIAAAACGSSSSATPGASPTAGPASTPVASPAGSSGASPSAAGQIDLFNTAYAPAQGADGGTAILGDWQEATQFNPYYLTQVTEANVASAGVVDARRVHGRLQVRARPRDPGPDAGQRRREGPGRQRRRDDRDLDPARRAEVVRRPGPHVRRLQVRLGVGAQPRQRRRRHLGLRRRHGLGLPVRDRDGPALQERLRGLHHDGRSPRCRATTCPRSRSRTRSTAPASGRTRSRSCRPAARSSSSP